VVVGSLNVDATIAVDSIPVPGETVLGGPRQTFIGGKGLNQAVAAARAGARTAMVGRVGDDDGGRMLRQSLDDHGVDHRFVLVDQHQASGTAFITVDARGENAIVVSPGANGALTEADVANAADAVAAATVVLVQLEVPMSVVEATVATATGTVILNPAPAQSLPVSVLSGADIVIPILARPEPTTRAEVVAMVGDLRTLAGVETQVIVTLGHDGVLVVDNVGGNDIEPVAAPAVEAVDTTGAGDCFCGALAARLALGTSPTAALQYAMHSAALSVTRPGASDSIPSADEVVMFLSSNER
jgi:ribokinase